MRSVERDDARAIRCGSRLGIRAVTAIRDDEPAEDCPGTRSPDSAQERPSADGEAAVGTGATSAGTQATTRSATCDNGSAAASTLWAIARVWAGVSVVYRT